MSPIEGNQEKYNIPNDIKTLLGNKCEVKKIMTFLKEIEMFEEI